MLCKKSATCSRLKVLKLSYLLISVTVHHDFSDFFSACAATMWYIKCSLMENQKKYFICFPLLFAAGSCGIACQEKLKTRIPCCTFLFSLESLPVLSFASRRSRNFTLSCRSTLVSQKKPETTECLILQFVFSFTGKNPINK